MPMFTERTMLLIFSASMLAGWLLCLPGKRLTDVNDIAAAAGIEMQRGVACRAILVFKLADEFIKAGFVRNVAA